MQVISLLPENFLASEKGLCYTGLVSIGE